MHAILMARSPRQARSGISPDACRASAAMLAFRPERPFPVEIHTKCAVGVRLAQRSTQAKHVSVKEGLAAMTRLVPGLLTCHIRSNNCKACHNMPKGSTLPVKNLT